MIAVKIVMKNLWFGVVVGVLFLSSCSPPEPVTVGSAQAELERVLKIWESGDYSITGKQRSDLRGFFDSMLTSNTLESFTIESGKATGKPSEILFETKLVCKSIMGSVMSPGPSKPREVSRSYYVYRPKRRWVVESGEMRAFQERMFGE